MREAVRTAAIFKVIGAPVGYVRVAGSWKTTKTGKKVNTGRFSKEAKRYHAYKQDIEACAKFEGRLTLPLQPTSAEPIFIATRMHVASARFPDPGNVQKAVEDTLCYQAKHGDKFVAGFYPPAEMIDKDEQPWVDVIVGPYDQDMEDLARRFFNQEEIG